MTRRARQSGAAPAELIEGLELWEQHRAETFPGIRSAVCDAIAAGEPAFLSRRLCFMATARVDLHLADQLFGRHTGDEDDLFTLAADGGLTLRP
jgi:hypothetical protein